MLIAVKSFYRHLFRALLNSLCIAIGISAVLVINALSNHGIDSANVMLNRMGINGYLITAPTISNQDIIKLNDCNDIACISPITSHNVIDESRQSLSIIGGDTDIKKIYSISVIYGNFFNSSHVDSSEPVCVISSNMAKERFGTISCRGQNIAICINSITQQFKVIGVYKSDSVISATENNEPLYVPYTVVEDINSYSTKNLLILAKDTSNQIYSSNIIEKHCDSIFGENTYSFKNTAADREKIDSLMNIIKSVLEIIVSVSLVVSIVGLMVIMIINIRSRVGEIGLKKALGASNKSIIIETCTEAAITTIVGIFQGYLLYSLIQIIMKLFNIALYTDISIALISSSTTVLSALIISLIPAYIAARVDPAKALKSNL